MPEMCTKAWESKRGCVAGSLITVGQGIGGCRRIQEEEGNSTAVMVELRLNETILIRNGAKRICSRAEKRFAR